VFDKTPGGGVGGSALGTTSVGDVVEAYWLDNTPPTLAFYDFRAANPEPTSPQVGWSGPSVLAAGYEARMADGAAGLFLLSEDPSHGNAQPNVVDIRKYRTSSHDFGRTLTLAVNPTTLEYNDTAAVSARTSTPASSAAVWPLFDSSGFD
jgi:hypothetical protein